tara:strand:+ start:357 stop:620 length:264 start_codon:yes stop_codon:yes gene_type:complete
MTKIYIYCLFDKDDNFKSVYSSIKAVHRDAMKLCNQGTAAVIVEVNGVRSSPSLTLLRNVFKGETDIKVKYLSDQNQATIIKTKLRE